MRMRIISSHGLAGGKDVEKHIWQIQIMCVCAKIQAEQFWLVCSLLGESWPL